MAEPGETIASRYRLDEVVGRGGMASVYRAWDLRLVRPVAVKLLRPEILADPDLALRFRREAHAATVLRHPNVVACLDTGTDRDSPFLVMELVDGEDLAARLRREPRLAPHMAVTIARDVARGLAIAHVRGIVHRDVKPGNILLANDGRAMVTDFGIARLAAEAEATLPGTTLGSVHYFSPEQAQGRTTTPASDVYSLGLVLYEMLTGTRPFGGDSAAAIAVARVGAVAPSTRDVDPALPSAVDAIVVRALAQDPGDRYPNGGAMADALDALLASPATDPGTATQRIPVSIPGGGPAAVATATPTGRGTGGRTIRGAGVAAGVLAVIGVLVALTLFGGEPDVAAIDATPSPQPTELAAAPTPEPSAPSLPPASDAPAETADPRPTAVPPGTVADLCQPNGGQSCRLGSGAYRPSAFEPPLTIELGEGWSVFRHTDQLVVFERPEGYLTVASNLTTMFDGEEAYEVGDSARDLLDAVRDNDALEIIDESRVRIAGRPAVQLDLVTEGERSPIFATDEDTYYAETTTVTRLLGFELRNTPVLVVLEGAGGTDLATFARLAEGALESLAFD